MATNGYTYTRGYATTASPSWADALLQGSNECKSACSWTDDGDLIIAFATAADVVIINKDDSIQVGYATLAGGFNGVVKLGNYLYLLDTGVGVYRLDISGVDCQSEEGDLTPGGWAVWADNSNEGNLPDDDARAIYGWTSEEATHKEYLAIVTGKSYAGYSDDLGHLTVYNVTDGVHYDSAATANFEPNLITGDGKRLYMTTAHAVMALYDAEAVAADSFSFDVVPAGRMGDDFTGSALVGWATYVDPAAAAGSVSLDAANDRMTMAIQTEGDKTNRTSKAFDAGFWAGDFTLTVKFDVSAWPDDGDMTDGHEVYVGIYLKQHDGSDAIQLIRSKLKTGGVVHNYLRYDLDGAGSWTNTSYSEDTFWLRLIRSGANVTMAYSNDGSTFTPWAGQGHSAMDTGPLYLRLDAFSNFKNDGGAGGAWTLTSYVESVTTDHSAGTAYSTTLPRTAITAIDVSGETSRNDTSSLFLGYASGAFIIDTDEDPTGLDDECDGIVRGPYDSNGGTYGFLPADAITAIGCTTDAAPGSSPGGSPAGAGYMLVATASGITRVSLANSADKSADGYVSRSESTDQPLIDNDVTDITLSSSWLLCAPAGGEWIDIDTTAPDDGTLSVRMIESTDNALIGASKSASADFSYATLQRASYNPSTGVYTYSTLQTDGTWGTGSDKSFTASNFLGGYAGWLDTESKAAGKWRYKLTQTDEAGNESDGVTADVYTDIPKHTSITIKDPDTDNTSTSQTRGVRVKLNNVTSGDSSSVADAVEYCKVWNATVDSEGASPLREYIADQWYHLALPSDEVGNYTVKTKLYHQNLNPSGSSVSGSIYYDPDAAGGSRASAENMIICHDFTGDSAVVTGTNDDSSFPASNVTDNRIGKRYQSADDSASRIILDLRADHTLRYIAIGGHNFGSATWTSLLLQYSTAAEYPVWGNELSLVALADQDWIVIDCESSSARYVSLYMSATTGPSSFQVGRIVVATDSNGGITQPSTNFSNPHTYTSRANYDALHVTPSSRYAANYRTSRAIEIPMEYFSQSDKRQLWEIHEDNGQHEPVLFIGKPEILPTLSGDGWDSAEDAYKANNYVLYGYLDMPEMPWDVTVNDYASGMLRIEEAIE